MLVSQPVVMIVAEMLCSVPAARVQVQTKGRKADPQQKILEVLAMKPGLWLTILEHSVICSAPWAKTRVALERSSQQLSLSLHQSRCLQVDQPQALGLAGPALLAACGLRQQPRG
jgi:hypothetical protein